MIKYRAAQAFIGLVALGLIGVITWAAWDSAGWAGALGFLGGLVLCGGFLAAMSIVADGKP